MRHRHLSRLTLLFILTIGLASLQAAAHETNQRSTRHTATAASTVVVDLTSYGAAGDGVTDDAPAVQQALDALAAAGGGTLFVPAGRYALLTPVRKDFSAAPVSITIRGAEPVPVDDQTSPNRSLGLTSEFLIKEGDQNDALTLTGIDELLVQDLTFIGDLSVMTDARLTLSLTDVAHATVRHCEFYGLASFTPEGGVVWARHSDLHVEDSAFLGCTAASGLTTSIVQNTNWLGISVTNTRFVDYGWRPDYFSKTGLGAPFAWISIANAAKPEAQSVYRAVVIRDVFLDEGGYMGIACIPQFFTPPNESIAPIDLIYIARLRMNVTNVGDYGVCIKAARRVLIKDSYFGWSVNADAAIALSDVGQVLLDQVECAAHAFRIRADAGTGQLTAVNSIYQDLASAAQDTKIITTASTDDDPVQWVRDQLPEESGLVLDPLAVFYWSDNLLRCQADNQCADDTRAALTDYLASTPPLFFSLSGRVTDNNGAALAGRVVRLHGGKELVATTDSNGVYAFPPLPTSSAYTLTTESANYTFAPPSYALNNPVADQSLQFNGTLVDYTINGQVRGGGSGLADVPVTLSGSQEATTTTDADGNFSFVAQAEGNYIITPADTPYFSFAAQSLNNLSGNQTLDFNGTLRTYEIGGRIADNGGTALSGVNVTLSGMQSGTTQTDANGNYSFALPANGNYTITPTLANHTFTPSRQSFNSLSSDQTANFTATLNTYTISGQITDNSNNPLSSVSVNLTGAQTASATTNATGNYSFTVNAGGNYTVAPANSCYTFAPPNSTFNNLSANQTANFTGTLNTYTISGHIVDQSNSNLSGVTVTLSGGASATMTTDSSGNYSFTGLACAGSYTVTPSKTNYFFAPANRVFNNLSANQTGDFTATLNTYTISGQVAVNGTALSGVTINLSGSATALTTTDAGGRYTFTVNGGGNYTVTPTLACYTFASASQSFSNLSANQTANFAATFKTYTLSGHIADTANNSLASVTLTLSGSQAATTTTDAAGNYAFTQLACGGNYTVTASKPDYVFAPANRVFNNLSANQPADFAATHNVFTLSGQIRAGNNQPVAGVTVALSGAQAATTTTDANGSYSFTNLPAGSNYAVTPALAGYQFAPASQTFTNLSANQSGDFTALAVVQFATAAFSFSEDAGRAIVEVTRTGDLSGRSTISYRTLDSTPDINCADTTTLPGMALARCDYAPTSDVLAFAPGETSKTISIPLINDAHVEPDETFRVALSDAATGATLGPPAIVTITIKDNDVAGEANPISQTSFFVRQHYLDFLSREPEADEPWSAILNRCADPDNFDPNSPSAACDRIAVSTAFFGSPEFRLKGYFVYLSYKVAFGSSANPNYVPAYDEIITDMRQVTGQTADEVFQKKAAFTEAFTAREAFQHLYEPMSNAAYVDALLGHYNLTSINTPDPANPDGTTFVTLTRDDLINRLNAQTLTRGQVLRAIAQSREVDAREFNGAFVAMQYYGYLRRTPETSGYNAWLNYLNAHPTDFRTMINGFLNSTEYKLRFGPVP